jgi:alkyl sulfatase BDS1-like metallo-beta-lactamase superfamily hydrolase
MNGKRRKCMPGYTDLKQFEAVIDCFVERIKTDEELARLCKGIKCTMGFDIYDPDLSFHLEFLDGVVSGGVGQADPPSQVYLEMSSETLDGMMTGEIDAASAAMSGEMSFSGDMSAAMGLQALGDDMYRVYQEAKKQVVG